MVPIRILTSPADLAAYDVWVRSHPQGSLWQSLAWKTYQALRRETRVYGVFQGQHVAAGALVVIDRTRGGLSTWDIPRGPLGSGLLETIVNDARSERALACYFSPPHPISSLQSPVSKRFVYPEATRIIDLTASEDQILAQMHQKGRYNIRVAQKHGIAVRASDDVGAFHSLLTATAARDAFRGHSKAHYEAFLKHLREAFLLLAYLPEPIANGQLKVASDTGNSSLATDNSSKPIAGLLGVIWKDTCMYYYGASSHAHRNLMAPYLLQWEAMLFGKRKGCVRFDLFGVAPADAGIDHPWAGISDFKAKFGGSVVTSPPEQMIVLRPWTLRGLGWKRTLFG